jgi:hypothetical protein
MVVTVVQRKEREGERPWLTMVVEEREGGLNDLRVKGLTGQPFQRRLLPLQERARVQARAPAPASERALGRCTPRQWAAALLL